MVVDQVGPQSAHKRAIDLQNVNGKSVEIIKRRKSLAEIIEAKRNFALFELGQGVRCDAGVLDQGAFSDFEAEIPRIHSGFLENVVDFVDEIAIGHLFA